MSRRAADSGIRIGEKIEHQAQGSFDPMRLVFKSLTVETRKALSSPTPAIKHMFAEYSARIFRLIPSYPPFSWINRLLRMTPERVRGRSFGLKCIHALYT